MPFIIIYHVIRESMTDNVHFHLLAYPSKITMFTRFSGRTNESREGCRIEMFLKTMNDPDLYNLVVYTSIQRGEIMVNRYFQKRLNMIDNKGDVVCGIFTHGHGIRFA